MLFESGADLGFLISAIVFLGLLVLMLLIHIFRMAAKRRAFDESENVEELENLRFKLPATWSVQKQPLMEAGFDQSLPRIHDSQESILVFLNERKNPVLRVLKEDLDHAPSRELLNEMSQNIKEKASNKEIERSVQKALESTFAWWQELRAQGFLRDFKLREQVALPLPSFALDSESESGGEIWSLLLEGSYYKKRWMKIWLIPLGSTLITLVSTRQSEDEIEWILEKTKLTH